MSSRARVAVLVSGTGRSLENLVEKTRSGELECEIALVVSSTPKAFALERARRHEILGMVVDPDRRLSPDELGRDVFAAVESVDCDVVVMAGFLRLVKIPARWIGRVL